MSWNFYKRAYLAWTEDWINADKYASFWMFPKSFYHSFILYMTLIHLTTGLTQADLRDFEKHENM